MAGRRILRPHDDGHRSAQQGFLFDIVKSVIAAQRRHDEIEFADAQARHQIVIDAFDDRDRRPR
jgi:hypothetical protein